MSEENTIEDSLRDAALWALYEVGTITILSLVPLFFIAYYQYIVQDNGFTITSPNPNHLRFSDFAYSNIAAGQLAFYAIANWAVVAWLCGIEPKRQFPIRPILIVLCILGFTYCGVLIAVTATKNYIPSDAVTVPSALTYAISIICYFVLLVLRQMQPPSVESTNIAEASSLHREVNKLRGEING